MNEGAEDVLVAGLELPSPAEFLDAVAEIAGEAEIHLKSVHRAFVSTHHGTVKAPLRRRD